MMNANESGRAPAWLLCFLAACFFSASSATFAEEDLLPWQKLYTGTAATGPSVLAYWQFEPGQEAKDLSGHRHDLKLRGQSKAAPEGKFGGCLESFASGPERDRAEGALVKSRTGLSPEGPFTVELWFKPKEEFFSRRSAFLIDKKYYHYVKDLPQANHDYCLWLTQTSGKQTRFNVGLGFGKDSSFYSSKPFSLEAGQWYHAAFTYDGQGAVKMYLDGAMIGESADKDRGPISPGQYTVTIGDRYGSTHSGFPGFIDQVRISNGVIEFSSGKLVINVGNEKHRTVFRRMEEDIRMKVTLMNDTGKPLTGLKARIGFPGMEKDMVVPGLGPKEKYSTSLPLDTSLRPDSYNLAVSVSGSKGRKPILTESQFPIIIVPRSLPNQMPVVMWGGGDFERLKKIGFTHHLFWLGHFDRPVWKAGKPTADIGQARLEGIWTSLDKHLAEGIGAVLQLYPGRTLARDPRLKKYLRIDRAGLTHDNLCASFPEVLQYGYNVGAAANEAIRDFPAAQASLIHSEIRDGTSPCFHPHDKKAFRQYAGFGIPSNVLSKSGVRYTRLKNFPANRIVADDHPLLVYYRWFWKGGDGWNRLHTQIHRGLKSMGLKQLWTFFDPAVRVPPIWGSGGEVNVISQWTYVYPDPIKIGQAADELFCMAEGQPGQQVMKMTQIIWYRRQTAPKLPEKEADKAPWEKEIPDARFITIAPDHLREALWCELARPVRGVMYHGWQSLVSASGGSYRYTNPETKEVLKNLIRAVVRPLGPTLLQVPDRKADVALLESFTSSMFAGRGTWGWSGGWIADTHLILQWAHLQPRIVYEETILKNGLDDYKVLVMPHCDVLTESIARKIQEFQRRGGLLVADEFLAPALTPDILLESYTRTGKADADKSKLQTKAKELRSELDDFYQGYGDADNPDVVIRFRQYRDSDYLFAINDRRTFGRYVGHHGRVMEKGLPTSATITIRRKRGWVYDLTVHKAVPTEPASGGIKFTANFGPGGGRLFLITSRPVRGIKLSAPKTARLGKQTDLSMTVESTFSRAIPAIVPVRVELVDPQGRLAECSGFYGAKGGRAMISYDFAKNDLPGTWTVRATESATGKTQQRTIRVGP